MRTITLTDNQAALVVEALEHFAETAPVDTKSRLSQTVSRNEMRQAYDLAHTIRVAS